MGSYKEVDGDLIKMFKNGEFDVMAHGCNCYATMGAGIALTVGNEFPEAKQADEDLEIQNGIKRLGKLSYIEIDIDKKSGYDTSLLFNLYTQYNPGRDFRMNSFIKSIKAMKKVIKEEMSFFNDKGKLTFEPENIRIGLPLIGCGIAGGDWGEVSEQIKEILSDFDVTIIHFKEKVLGVNYFPTKKKTIGTISHINHNYTPMINNRVANNISNRIDNVRQKINWEDLTDEEFEQMLKTM